MALTSSKGFHNESLFIFLNSVLNASTSFFRDHPATLLLMIISYRNGLKTHSNAFAHF